MNDKFVYIIIQKQIRNILIAMMKVNLKKKNKNNLIKKENSKTALNNIFLLFTLTLNIGWGKSWQTICWYYSSILIHIHKKIYSFNCFADGDGVQMNMFMRNMIVKLLLRLRPLNFVVLTAFHFGNFGWLRPGCSK